MLKTIQKLIGLPFFVMAILCLPLFFLLVWVAEGIEAWME